MAAPRHPRTLSTHDSSGQSIDEQQEMTIGGKPWKQVLDDSGVLAHERLVSEAKEYIQQIVALWPHDKDGIWKLLDRLTVAERDMIHGLPWHAFPRGLASFLELTFDDMNKEEGWIADGATRIDSDGEEEVSMGDMATESVAGGMSSSRKHRINAVNSILNYLEKMRHKELYDAITRSRPNKTDKDNVWNDWFVMVAKEVTAKMHTLTEDNNVLKVMGKVGELELAHGGVMSQVARVKIGWVP